MVQVQKTLRVGIAGLGAVGRVVAEELVNDPCFEVVAVAARRPKPWMKQLNADFVDRPILLGERSDIDVVVECLSGITTAYETVHRALSAAKPVVSSNTMLAAVHGQALTTVARVQNVTYDWQYAAVTGLPLQAMMAGMAMQPVRISTTMALDVQHVLDRMRLFEESAAVALGMVRHDRAGHGAPVDASGKHHWARLLLLRQLCFGGWAKGGDGMKQAQPLALEKITAEDSILVQQMGGELRVVGEMTADNMAHGVQIVQEAQAHRMDAMQEYLMIEQAETDMPLMMSLTPQTPRSVGLGIVNSLRLLAQRKPQRLPRRVSPAAQRPTANTVWVRVPAGQEEVFRRDARWSILQERKREGQLGAIVATGLPPVEIMRVLGDDALALGVWQPLHKQPAALGPQLRLVS